MQASPAAPESAPSGLASRLPARLRSVFDPISASHFRLFCTFLVLHCLHFRAHAASDQWGTGDHGIAVANAVGSLVILGVLLAGRLRAAMALSSLACFIYVVAYFPSTANHCWLYAWLLLVGASFDVDDPAEQASAVGLWRLLTALVFFQTGLQKLLQASYFRGEFVTAFADRKSGFFHLHSLLADGEEVERLINTPRNMLVETSFATDSLLLVLASNAVWVLEMALPFLLLFRKVRERGAVLCILFVLGIQALAVELVFGFLFAACLGLSLRERWFRPMVYVFLAIDVFLALVGHGALPFSFYFN